MLRRHMLRRPPLLLLLQLLLLDFYSLRRSDPSVALSRQCRHACSGQVGSFIALVPLRTMVFFVKNIFDGKAGPARHSSSFFVRCCRCAVPLPRVGLILPFKLHERWLTSRGTVIGARDS